MNPTVRDEGIVLRVDPRTNTSLHVEWLTRKHGRMATLLKGAQRPKSYLLGQLDLFYRCEIVWYRNPRGILHLARECYPLDTRMGLRRDWRACVAASWLCALVRQTLPQGGTLADGFTRLSDALGSLDQGEAPADVQHWFELQWLAGLGIEPRLHRCAACGSLPQRAMAGAVAFSAVRGGVLCDACRRANPAAGPLLILTADTHARLRRWQRTRDPHTIRDQAGTRGQTAEAESLLGAFIETHADIDLAGRSILAELLRPDA